MHEHLRAQAEAAPRQSRRQFLRSAMTFAALGVSRDLQLASMGEVAPLAAPLATMERAGEATLNVVVQWNRATLAAIRAARFGPPISARALAIVHTCIYDAWAAYHGAAHGTQFGDALRQPAATRTLANKQQAISYAAYRALIDLYPLQEPMFSTLLVSLGYDPGTTSRDPAIPSGVGNLVADAVLGARHADGANQRADVRATAYLDTTGYTPVNSATMVTDPERWQPLLVPAAKGGFAPQIYLTPHWGSVVPFALTSGAQFRPSIELALYPSTAYIDQAQEVLAYSAQLGDTEKVIADYWRDGPNSVQPPGHWCLIAQFVSQRDRHTLDADVQLFFTLANALFDASIACWDAKRAFDSPRPITAIRYLFDGITVDAWGGPYKGRQRIRGEHWLPYQPTASITPPFPEFVSGHSTFSAAGAAILQRWTGSDLFGSTYTARAGTSPIEPGFAPTRDVTLSWQTFSAAAQQAGLSRLFGGIHFHSGDSAGQAMGRRVAAQVWKVAQGYVRGAGLRGA